MKSIVNYLSLSAIVIVCGGAGYGVYRKSLEVSEQSPSKPKPPPMVVEVTQLRERPISDRVELVGSLEAVMQGRVQTRTAGYIKKLPYDIGDYVEQGALVVELDDSQAQEAFKKAEAALRVAQAQQEASVTREKQLQTKLTSYEDLLKRNVLTKQQVDDLRSDHEVAIADVALNRALVEQANSALETSRLNLEETKIKAALTGYISDRYAEVGDLADPNTPILNIVDLALIHTIVHVVEKDYDKIKLGQSAVVRVDAFPGKEFPGKVIRIAPRIDLETRTAAIQIEIHNSENYLKPGMYARVSLQFARKEKASVIPMATVQHDREERFVYIVKPKENTVERRNVTIGIEDGRFSEILQGLSADEKIVALGSRLIREGDQVDPVEAPSDDGITTENDPSLSNFSGITSE
jgi:membrane fusion protein, multidrug efflux system